VKIEKKSPSKCLLSGVHRPIRAHPQAVLTLGKGREEDWASVKEKKLKSGRGESGTNPGEGHFEVSKVARRNEMGTETVGKSQLV